MKRSPLERRTPLRKQSRKRAKEQAARRQVVADALERADYTCKARDLVPAIACWGPLDVDEYEARSARPGGHLDPDNVQVLCRRHHNWKHEHPLDAAAVGLRPYPAMKGPTT